MEKHLYLSLMPEALIASQLDPKAFGAYYAVGTEGKTQGQAAFFEINTAKLHHFFNPLQVPDHGGKHPRGQGHHQHRFAGRPGKEV